MKAKTTTDVKRGYVWGVLSGVAWGLDTVLIGLILSMYPFASIAALVVSGTLVCATFHDGFAAFWMSLFLAYKKKIKQLLPKLKTKDGVFCIVGAILGGPVGMSFYLLAIKNVGSAYTATITSSYPALSTFLAFFFLKEKLLIKGWLGLFLCIVGIISLSYEPVEVDFSSTFYLGILYAVISACGWALESVVCAYGMKNGEVDPEMALNIRELSSFVIYISIVIPLFCGGYAGFSEILSSASIVWLSLTAFVGVFSYLSWYKAIDTIGVSRGVSFNITYSFWAIIFSLLLNEGKFSFKLLLSCLMIIIGVILAVGKPKEVLSQNREI